MDMTTSPSIGISSRSSSQSFGTAGAGHIEYAKTRMPHPTRTEMTTPTKRHRLINQLDPTMRKSHVSGRMISYAAICLTLQLTYRRRE